MTPAPIRLHTTPDLVRTLCEMIAKTECGSRIALSTMMLDPDDPSVARILSELNRAASRSVRVELLVDAYTFLYPQRIGVLATPLPLGRAMRSRYLNVLSDLDRRANARVTVMNWPMSPVSILAFGRSHLKWVVVDDFVVIMGQNLHALERPDLAVSFEDSDFADWVWRMTRALAGARRTASALGPGDLSFTINEAATVLLDVGLPGRSTILSHATDLIANAGEWVFVSSQWFPTGTLADALAQAHRRGVRVEILYNDPGRHALLRTVHRAILFIERRRRPQDFFRCKVPLGRPLSHTKAVATESAALVGTHNFLPLLVRAGTPEVDVPCRDPEFAREVRNAALVGAYGRDDLDQWMD